MAAEQEADLVSYENEWYGPKAIHRSALGMGKKGKKGKRSVRIVRVGKEGMEGDSADEEREREEGTVGGGVAKRRRWLV